MVLENISKKKSENNKDFIYRVIRENIMTLNLKPGESINEVELGSQLNVSRTPIREALVKLSFEKLIDIFPQKGSFISKIDLSLIDEIIFLRELCEKEILKIACFDKNSSQLVKELEKNLAYQKIILDFDEDLHKLFDLDNQFHSLIFDYYNKKNIWKIIKKLAIHYDRLRLLDSLNKSCTLKIYEQHKKIIEIIENKSIEKIDFLISEHLLNFKYDIHNYLNKYPEYFKK